MTRKTATVILSSGLGQLISLTESKIGGRKRCVLSRLIPNGTWGYKEQHLVDRDCWLDVVLYVFPEALYFYDQRYDIIEQEYIDRLRDERKAERIRNRNSQASTLSNHVQE